VRILADTNIVAQAVEALRHDGHAVVHAAERPIDPGDVALLAEAVRENRVFLTKDHDIGALVYRDLRPHLGVLLVDDPGAPAAESPLVLAVLSSHGELPSKGAFPRAGTGGVRESQA
jgi:predicted nuclease of predicted toxin-antitoxin system